MCGPCNSGSNKAGSTPLKAGRGYSNESTNLANQAQQSQKTQDTPDVTGIMVSSNSKKGIVQ